MTPHVAPEAPGKDSARSCAELRELDDRIIELLYQRQMLVRDLPKPSGPRATDPAFERAVRDTTARYRERLGGGGELVARAVLVLCDPGHRS